MSAVAVELTPTCAVCGCDCLGGKGGRKTRPARCCACPWCEKYTSVTTLLG